jgi:hypothetical protein
MAALTAALVGIGTAASIYGQVKANAAEAEANRQNASFLREQADFAAEAGARELAIFKDNADQFFGNQVTSIGAGGVAVSGSALQVLADTKMRTMREEQAIKADTAFKQREALLRAGASMEQAERLSSFEANVLPGIGTIATTGASYYVNMSKSSGGSKGSSSKVYVAPGGK